MRSRPALVSPRYHPLVTPPSGNTPWGIPPPYKELAEKSQKPFYTGKEEQPNSSKSEHSEGRESKKCYQYPIKCSTISSSDRRWKMKTRWPTSDICMRKQVAEFKDKARACEGRKWVCAVFVPTLHEKATLYASGFHYMHYIGLNWSSVCTGRQLLEIVMSKIYGTAFLS